MGPQRVGENPPADAPEQVEEKLNRALDAKAADVRAAEVAQGIVEGMPPAEPTPETPAPAAEPVPPAPEATGEAETPPVVFEPGPTSTPDAFAEAQGLNDIDRAQLDRYAGVVADRANAQVAGDWGAEAQARDAQKKAFSGLTESAQANAPGYVSRANAPAPPSTPPTPES
jgi:hypothetical protein